MTLARMHDFLRLRPGAPLIQEGGAPGWVALSLAQAPWVVVRRGEICNGIIPVRVRGATTGRRFDSWVPVAAVSYRSTPEDLAGRRSEPWHAAQAPALAALARVDPVLTRLGHSWGPLGSVAFELATNLPAATPACDLDLVLRLEEPLTACEARRLLRELVEAATPVRVDVLVETRLGSVHLGDLVLRHSRVLVKTANGIRLLTDPWSEAA